MRAALILPLMALGLSGCMIQTKEVERPQVAVRYDSTKTAKVFAECAAEAMGRKLQRDGETFTILLTDGGMLRARWDFLATLEGSQAELRGPTSYDAGSEAVRGCA